MAPQPVPLEIWLLMSLAITTTYLIVLLLSREKSYERTMPQAMPVSWTTPADEPLETEGHGPLEEVASEVATAPKVTDSRESPGKPEATGQKMPEKAEEKGSEEEVGRNEEEPGLEILFMDSEPPRLGDFTKIAEELKRELYRLRMVLGAED